jgi:serine/threonine-protein kinase
MLVSWVRIFDGRFRDPLVGRDLLVGALFGISGPAVSLIVGLIPGLSPLDYYGPDRNFWSCEALRGLRQTIAAVLGIHTQGVLVLFVGILGFLVLRVLIRRTWIPIILVSLIAMVLSNPGQGNPTLYVITFLLSVPLAWLVLFRFGLLSVMVGSTITDLLTQMPLSPDLASWKAAPTVVTLMVVLGLGAWGFWISLAGRPLFRDELQEREAGA